MTRAEFEFFLLFASILCLVMAAVSAIKSSKNGSNNYFLTGAFLGFGLAMLVYRAAYEPWLVAIPGILAFVCLVGDFMVRARNQVLGGDRR